MIFCDHGGRRQDPGGLQHHGPLRSRNPLHLDVTGGGSNAVVPCQTFFGAKAACTALPVAQTLRRTGFRRRSTACPIFGPAVTEMEYWPGFGTLSGRPCSSDGNPKTEICEFADGPPGFSAGGSQEGRAWRPKKINSMGRGRRRHGP